MCQNTKNIIGYERRYFKITHVQLVRKTDEVVQIVCDENVKNDACRNEAKHGKGKCNIRTDRSEVVMADDKKVWLGDDSFFELSLRLHHEEGSIEGHEHEEKHDDHCSC